MNRRMLFKAALGGVVATIAARFALTVPPSGHPAVEEVEPATPLPAAPVVTFDKGGHFHVAPVVATNIFDRPPQTIAAQNRLLVCDLRTAYTKMVDSGALRTLNGNYTIKPSGDLIDW